MDDLERRRRRLRRARHLIRTELAFAVVVPIVAGFLFIAAPGGPTPMFSGRPPLIETLVPWAGVAVYIFGLTWMIRLSRPDPEAGERSWRYRDF